MLNDVVGWAIVSPNVARYEMNTSDMQSWERVHNINVAFDQAAIIKGV